MKAPLQILHVANSPAPAEWIASAVAATERVCLLRRARPEDASSPARECDVVLVDEPLRAAVLGVGARADARPIVVLGAGLARVTPAQALAFVREGARAVVDEGDVAHLACVLERCAVDAERGGSSSAARLEAAVEARAPDRASEAPPGERELRRALAVDAAQVGTWDLDPVAGRLAWTGPFDALWGYAPGAFPGTLEAFTARVHPDDLGEMDRIGAEAQRARAPFSWEYRVAAADGRVRWISSRGRHYFDADGTAVRVMGVMQDVTARKEAELALRDSELRLRLAVEAAQLGTWEWDLATGRHVWSEAQERLWGYEPGAFPGTLEAFVERIHPDDRDALFRAGERSKVDREPFGATYRVVRPDGTTRQILCHGQYLFDARGEPSRVVGVVHDDTERQEAQAALRRREEIFASVIRQASDAIAVFDGATGRFLEFNPAAHEDLGYTRDEFATLGVGDLQAQRAPEELQGNLDAVRRSGGVDFVTQHRRRDGALRDVRVSIRALPIPGCDYQSAVWTDLTDRLLAEARAARESARNAFLLELHQRAPQLSDAELYDYVLERAVELTGSDVGFLHRVSEDQATVLLTAWSKRARQMYTAELGPRYPLTQAGIWADCIRERRAVVVNDYAAASGARGLPAGHAPIARFASVPVIQDGLVRVVFAVGNKPAPYDDDDVTQLQIVTNELHKLVLQRAAQARLAESEARFRSLVEAAFDWIWEVDAEGRYTYASPQVAQLLGRSPEELIGKRPFDFMAPEESARVRALFADHIARRAPFSSIVNANLHRDGSVVVLETSGVPILAPDGALLGYRGVDRDITERQRAEEERARLAAAIEQAAESIVITDPSGRIVYANPAFERTSGWTRAEALGKNPRILKSGKQDDAFYRGMWGTLAHGDGWHGRLVNRRKDGAIYEEDATISPLRDAEGQVVNYVAIKLDVTRQVELEATLRQAQKLDAVGQLAGGVAHDFNNILAAMIMQVELLQAEISIVPAVRAGLDDVAAYAHRAADLTRQLLLFSRRSLLVVKTLELNALIGNLLKMLQRIIGEDVQLRFEASAEPCSIAADAGMIEQVVLNLVVNARDAMPRGGELVLGTTTPELGADATERHAEGRAGRFVCLCVTDTGQGMDAATLKRIFEPFFTTKGVGKGTGLGLATVHGIVAQHKGWIEVESEVGRGSRFRVFLPALAAAPSGEAVAAAGPRTLAVGRERVLFVEDDPQLRKLVSRSLARLGYAVTEAADAPSALASWERLRAGGEPVDLLLTDMVLPGGTTGLELAGRLRRQAPALRVVISSGYSPELSRGGAPIEGSVFLPKPYAMHTLARVVREALDRRG